MSGTKLMVVGNWKMNPPTLSTAKKLFMNIRQGLGRQPRQVEIVVAPPYPYLSDLQRLSLSGRIALAAQKVFFMQSGAYTGEVSVSMLQSVGVTVVITGHSEQRALGTTDGDVAKQVEAILKSKAAAIICVGEQRRDKNGDYFSAVENQLRTALRSVKSTDLRRIVIAYEPVWAIGTGKTASPADAHEMKLFIQKVLSDLYSRKAANRMRILYGGSVKPGNAAELLAEGEVDGFLIGGASLVAKEFVEIANLTETYVATKTA